MSPIPPASDLLTSAQVAARLGISRSYCGRLLRRLGVPRVALGHRTVRYRYDDVQAAIARAAGGGAS
jgi:excisionase family DNA binding protein